MGILPPPFAQIALLGLGWDEAEVEEGGGGGGGEAHTPSSSFPPPFVFIHSTQPPAGGC